MQIKPAIYLPVIGDKVKQEKCCSVIAFNKDQTVMIAGCSEKIKVFEFKLGQLNLQQMLSGHKQTVTTLYFFKKSDEFISGGVDNQILIWAININQLWYCKQCLEGGHYNSVTCVIMNRSEDLIISCSWDKSIKFWAQKNEWGCSQTLTYHTNYVRCISLNDSQNQLVSCGLDEKIIISQLDGDMKWKVIQKIIVESSGYRLCFVGDNTITYQPKNEERMEIFEENQQTKLFIKKRNIKVDQFIGCDWCFPQAFNKEKQILLNKNGQTIYLMKKLKEADFVIVFQHSFGTQCVWGAMTDNAEYLVTWDVKSKKYQLLKWQQE